MKKIETTNIAGIVKAPYIKVTHDHYVQSIRETTAQLVLSEIGSYTANDIIILRGCEVVVTGSTPGITTATLSAGAIYYNGEIYEVDANGSLATTGTQTYYWEVVTTYAGGDPIVWSDGISRNLHRIDKLQLVNGTSGDGLGDYDASTVKYKNYTTPTAFQTSLSVFSNSNCTSPAGVCNIIRVGNTVTMSFRATMIVTTGASLSGIAFDVVDKFDFIASTTMVGTLQVRNETTGAHLYQAHISNGLNSTDVLIDANKRINIGLTGGSVANGQTVSFVVQFTAKATV